MKGKGSKQGLGLWVKGLGMYEGYTSGKQGVRVAHMVNLFLVCVLGVYVLTVMFPGHGGFNTGKDAASFSNPRTHTLSPLPASR